MTAREPVSRPSIWTLEYPPLKHRRRDAAARCGHRRAMLPAVACRIIRFVQPEISRIVAVDAAAYGIKAPL
jgi:hypothetical protein